MSINQHVEDRQDTGGDALPVLAAALAFCTAGCSIVLAAADGSKKPLGAWKQYQQQAADTSQVYAWLGRGHPGFGIITGRVSGGLEMLEFEGAAVKSGMLQTASELADAAGLTDVWHRLIAGYMETTPSGGVHFLYRLTDIPVPGNTKLAMSDGNVLAETRGEGGFVIVAPSHGPVHPTGLPWRLAAGNPDTIPAITAEERGALHSVIRTLGDQPPAATPFQQPASRPRGDGTVSPIDDYNKRIDWADILIPLGWALVAQRGEERYWRRPGKTIGMSATTDRSPYNNLYVFSTSTQFKQQHPYSKAGVLAELEHGGDFKATVRALGAAGYGTPAPVRTTTATMPATGAAVAPETAAASDPLPGEPMTELGYAKRLVAVYGDQLRHVVAWNRWLVWDGKRWAEDKTGQAHRWAKVIARRLTTDAMSIKDDAERRKAFSAARKAESSASVRAVLTLAATESEIVITPDDLDADPYLLNCANGTLDLHTGQLRPHDPRDLITKLARGAYDPDASGRAFTAFLDRVQPDPEMRAYLARLTGHGLVGQVVEHLLPIHCGTGANGKSTYTAAVSSALGDYADAADPDLLTAKTFDAHPTSIADLYGLRIGVLHETDKGRRLSESTVKRLTGGDRLKARRMREDFWSFAPSHTFLLLTNHKPVITGTDEGIWRRIRLFPWPVAIPAAERDEDLGNRIALELDYVLTWLVQGCLDWQQHGLADPDAVIAATADYRDESDELARFLAERCVVNVTAACRSGELYKAWEKWCAGEGTEPGTQTAFSIELNNRGFDKKRGGVGFTWRGIGLRTEEAE